jgi:alpha-1,2-mannosyltransferase
MLSDNILLQILRSKPRVALFGDVIRALVVALLVLVAMALIRYYTLLAENMFSLWHMNDFGKFYYSTQAFLAGGNMYGPTLATSFPITQTANAYLGNMNPPHFHLLLLPLAHLEPRTAIVLWAGASVISLLVSFRLIGRELNIQWTFAAIACATFATIVCAATGAVIVTGQVTFLLMLPMTLAWICARNGRWASAAVWLGILASVKLFLAVFLIYFAVRRRWRAMLVMVLTALTCFGVGTLTFGVANQLAWLRELSGVDWAWLPMNASVGGFLSRTLGPSPVFASIANVAAAVKPVAAIAMFVMLGVTTRATAIDQSRHSVDRAFMGFTLAALLVSPLGWIYYVWILAGPALAVWLDRSLTTSPASKVPLALATVGLTMPLFVPLIGRSHPFGTVTLGSIYFWTLFALWLSLVTSGRGQRPARPIAPES